MAKSLKEALLEKFADLQSMGIAPTTAPVEDDGPAVTVEMGPDSYGDGRGRQRGGRGGMYDDDRRGADMPFRARANRGGPPVGRGGRGTEQRGGGGDRGRSGPPGGGERFRRPDRGGERAALEGLPMPGGPAPRPSFGPGPGGPRPPFNPAGPRPPFNPAGPGGPRPPFADRGPRPGGPGGPPMGGPRPGGPGGPGGPQMGPDPRIAQQAERRRREAGQRDELLALIAQHGGTEATPEVFDKFLADLTVETGALPDVGRVLDAVKLANSIEAAKVGNAVRQLFRRSRVRPAGAPGAPAARPAPAGPVATAPAPAPAAAPAPVAQAAPPAEVPAAAPAGELAPSTADAVAEGASS